MEQQAQLPQQLPVQQSVEVPQVPRKSLQNSCLSWQTGGLRCIGQADFRPGKSTIPQLIALQDLIDHALDAEPGPGGACMIVL